MSGTVPATGKTRLDFRSDTRTCPDRVMRTAMADAEVGDDAYLDDPTVIRIEEEGARLLNTRATLFMPSATMANLVAVLTIALAPGASLITGIRTHIGRFEAAAMSRFAGVRVMEVAQSIDGA